VTARSGADSLGFCESSALDQHGWKRLRSRRSAFEALRKTRRIGSRNNRRERMSNSNRTAGRNRLGARLVAAALFVAAIAGPPPARAAGACALVPNGHAPTEKMLQCGENLTVRPAHGARYQPLYKKGDPLPVGIRLNDGALLIEYHLD
jgi:hypothetical protein